MSIETRATQKRRIRAKLIFNPRAGIADESPLQLLKVINELQARKIVPETYLVEPDCDLSPVIREALRQDIRLFIVSGGDGTVENVAGLLVETKATLGIIPTGTQNNVALSLGIPDDIPAAVALLRTGRRIKADVGLATCGSKPENGQSRLFLEACSVGLVSALYPVVDDIQHGNLARIGDFLAMLISSPLAEIHLLMDSQKELHTQGHVVMVANLPYVGPHYPVAPKGSYTDGLLDVLVFADLSKLDLLSHVVQIVGGSPEDPRIQRFRARQIEINTNPLMPVIVDGVSLGEGPLSISVQRRALRVIAGNKPAAPLKTENNHPGGMAELPGPEVENEL